MLSDVYLSCFGLNFLDGHCDDEIKKNTTMDGEQTEVEPKFILLF